MFVGHASGNLDYFRHNYREQHDLYRGTRELHRAGEYSTDIFAEAAVDFIQRASRASRPWFCYLPFNAPHFPSAGNRRPGEANIWQAPDWAFQVYGRSPDEAHPANRYAAVVTALDRALGRVLDAVEQAGVAENTFVFFMSDNGAFRLGRTGLDMGSNAPLRHGGVTCWKAAFAWRRSHDGRGRLHPGRRSRNPSGRPIYLSPVSGWQTPGYPKAWSSTDATRYRC